MKVFRRLALEDQLEIEKLEEKRKASYLNGEAGVLYDSIKTDQETEKKKEEEQGSEETPVSDDSATTDEEPTPEETPSGEDIPAIEEIRTLTYDPLPQGQDGSIAMENAFTTQVTDGAKSLMALGVEYAPKLLSGLYKGVVYVASKLTKLLLVSAVTVGKYIERRTNSFGNLKKQIQEYRKALELVKSDPSEDQDEEQAPYTNVKVINSLKIRDSVDFTANIKVLKGFTTSAIHGIDRQITTDIAAIKHLIAMAESGSIKIPQSILDVKPFGNGFQKGTLPGYPAGDDFTETYKYNEVLPSNVVLMATLPKTDLSNIEDISKAYNASSLSLGFDSASFKEVSSVNYMTADGLAEFLDSLEELCDACIAHQALYDKVAKTKHQLKFTFKSYVTSLASSSSKVSLKNSLIEYVYLKSVFLDKVYLVGAMDIHDYSSKVMSYGLSFVKDNLKKLT